MPKPSGASTRPEDAVFLGVITPIDVKAHFTRCLFDLALFDAFNPSGGRRFNHRSPTGWNIGTTLIFKSRNEIVRFFLSQDDADWLLMVDTDQTFDADLLEYLMAAVDADERPVVGVPIQCLRMADGATREAVVGHNVFAAAPPLEGQSVPFHLVPYEDLPLGEDTLVQVAAVGTGIMLVHRSVFVRIREWFEQQGMGTHWCWFQTPVYPPNLAEGEDLFFARMCANLGIPQFVHCGLSSKVGHVKSIILDSFDMPYERLSI